MNLNYNKPQEKLDEIESNFMNILIPIHKDLNFEVFWLSYIII